MRVRLSDPALIPDLLEYLESSPDVVATLLGDDEVEISLMGSLALDAMRMEVYLRVRAWEAAAKARGEVVELVDDP